MTLGLNFISFQFSFSFRFPPADFQGLEQKEAVQSGSVSYASRLVGINVFVLPVSSWFWFVTGVFWIFPFNECTMPKCRYLLSCMVY